MGRTVKPETKASPLDRLAELLGIESEYSDARGKVQRANAETKRALLRAMGVSADDDGQIDAGLKEIERAEWRRALQPVYVVRVSNEPIQVPVTVREQTCDLAWRLQLEDGTERAGRVQVGELALLNQHTVETEKVNRRSLPIGSDIPCGYHRLSISSDTGTATLIVTPQRCWLPPSAARGDKLWGVAAQLYLLKSRENWGIGDFSDLGRLAEFLAAAGADLLGLNPLHSLFPESPEHASPYSPASRLLLNILYIDVTQAPGFASCEQARALFASGEFQQELAASRAARLVDYTRVTQLKLQALRILFQHWNSSPGSSASSFAAFCREGKETLERHGVFHCLRQQFLSSEPALGDWHSWAEEYRDPTSDAVRRFAQGHPEEILFASWLQWVADEQLAKAAKAAETMEIGLYRDLAVGADMSGVETWSNQKAVVCGAHIGAPPDIFNPAGQDWGLPPFHPRELREQHYQSFIELIRANMRHAGALRVDHVMALQHLYWIPSSQPPRSGAYVRYPMEDLIGILALESQRNQCMVVGEDLGTVPDGFRERMAQANILSYRVLFFEQNMKTGVFRQPDKYPRLAVAVASNHDLPSIRAWWLGRDIELREELQLYPDAKEAAFQRRLRDRDRKQLRSALQAAGLVRKSAEVPAEELVRLVYAYLARSRSFAALIELGDVSGEIDPANVPGSTSQYPNWRRKLSLSLDEILGEPLLREIIQTLIQGRGSSRGVLENVAP
jgi:4-alpha-glucanotransferase